MKKYILLILLCIPLLSYSCNGYVLGFKGLNDSFDEKAFNFYVNKLNYCKKLYSWHNREGAIKFIKTLDVEYQLYGFSKGATTISYILQQPKIKKPEYVITVGAYKTTDVNFDRYKVKYNNYFDNSGKGQNSPGIFLNVSHSEIQKEVNRLIFNE